MTCTLIVLDCAGPSLYGRDLIALLDKTGVPIGDLTAPDPTSAEPSEHMLNRLLGEFEDVFSTELGIIKGPPASLKLKEMATPKFCKPRSLPYALRNKVSREIEWLVLLGVLSPVQRAERATPIVVVLKKDGNVRICGDFKVTLNPASEVEHYPLPVIKDMFASLNGGEYFSILDLKDAYNQVPLDVATSRLCVINTHRWIFRYNRLPFGIASPPAIF